MTIPKRIDLHMHTTVSDGTDTPEEILAHVKEAGIDLFSVTDHDAVKGCRILQAVLEEGDPHFITGAEFSCKDEDGQYHILGYHYDPESNAIRNLAGYGHNLRMDKIHMRLNHLNSEFHISFPEEELEKLLLMDNPGKPHLALLLVKHGYAETKEQAMGKFLDRLHIRSEFLRPEVAIEGILDGEGIPILAHPAYGNGNQMILGESMERRLQHLMDYGLQGIEAFYSGFTARIRDELLGFSEQYGLYVTAGSDYHGKNKLVRLADTGLHEAAEYPDGLYRFLEQIDA